MFELSLMKIQSEMGIPTPLPTAGIGNDCKIACLHNGSMEFSPSSATPDFSRFSGSRDDCLDNSDRRARPRRSRDTTGSARRGGVRHVATGGDAGRESVSRRGSARNICDHQISAGRAQRGLAGDAKTDRVGQRLRAARDDAVAAVEGAAAVGVVNDAEIAQVGRGRRAGRGKL